MILYASLYCLRQALPRVPWVGTPSLAQGCLFSWLGFALVGIVFETVGVIRGNRILDPAGMATFWGFVVLPLGLGWIVWLVVGLIRGQTSGEQRGES